MSKLIPFVLVGLGFGSSGTNGSTIIITPLGNSCQTLPHTRVEERRLSQERKQIKILLTLKTDVYL